MLKFMCIFDSGAQPAPPFAKQINSFFEETGISAKDIVNIQYDIHEERDYQAVYIIYEATADD